MEQRERDAEALRRRLYRPGASAADLAVYLRATEEERSADSPDEAAPAPAPVTSSMRPFAIGAAVVAAAALIGGVLLTSRPATPAATPVAAAPTAVATPAATPLPDGSFRVTFDQVEILDGGAIRHARGDATPEGTQLYRYVVAVGDTVPGIADRFGICPADVLDALPYGFDPGELPDGQGLELSRSESNEC